MHGVHPRAWELVAHAARREAVRSLHATRRDAQETVFTPPGVKHEKRREGKVTCVTPGGVSPCLQGTRVARKCILELVT